MKKFLILLIVLVFAGGYVGKKLLYTRVAGSPTSVVHQSDSFGDTAEDLSPTTIPQEHYSLPKTLSIPKINVTAAVESVGLDAQKAMDVPKDSDNVGWYNLGVKPGEKGNAVIDGHLDKVTGAPAVFWNISKLVPGDTLSVKDENGRTISFSVTKVTKYPYDNFPLQDVFGPSEKHRLNLISCNGVWNSKTHNYSQRTVVYSEQID